MYHYYNVENSHSLKYLDNAEIRVKRDINETPASVATPSTASTASDKVTKADTPTTTATTADTKPHLLGENGHGQRKDYSTPVGNGTTATPVAVVGGPSSETPTAAVAAAAEPQNSDNKTTINKSLGATLTPTKLDDLDDLIGNIDEPEEDINKTLSDHHFANATRRGDYFQYYNSTIMVDKKKSDEYWSVKKDYIVSSILSKSHRRAVVSVYSVYF